MMYRKRRFCGRGGTSRQRDDAAGCGHVGAGFSGKGNQLHPVQGQPGELCQLGGDGVSTSDTRAMLLGEAQSGSAWGVDTVLVSQLRRVARPAVAGAFTHIDDGGGLTGAEWKNPGGTYGHYRNGHSYPLPSVAEKAAFFIRTAGTRLTTWD